MRTGATPPSRPGLTHKRRTGGIMLRKYLLTDHPAERVAEPGKKDIAALATVWVTSEAADYPIDGRVADVHLRVSHQQPTLIALDQQSHAEVRPLGRAGKADRLAHQAFDPGVHREVLARDLLRVALARVGRIRLEMPRGGAPRVRLILRNAQRFQQAFALQ